VPTLILNPESDERRGTPADWSQAVLLEDRKDRICKVFACGVVFSRDAESVVPGEVCESAELYRKLPVTVWDTDV
jgi:hypothetical protein